MTTNETICAISTAPGMGGIAVVRVSGPEAIAICDRIYTARQKGKTLANQQAYTLSYGTIRHGDEPIDDVMAALFRSPHSYTGEDTVEISCHGSLYIQQQILQCLIDAGCRLARPGEFTQRAFMNGKMDLSQAEAVADLIASTSAGQHRLAMNQMRGGFSKELKQLREKLLHITSLMELELDFADHEELEFADRDELRMLAGQIQEVITRLIHSFRAGNVIKNGIPVAIIGETNSGKSTLLNTLLNEEKSIVSDIHGTTRDVIEDTLTLQGILFRFIDTAGIRETTDTIEHLGIERTFQKIKQARIVLWLIDSTEAEQQVHQLKSRILPLCQDKQLLIVLNKCDLMDETEIQPLSLPDKTAVITISAKEKRHIDELQQRLIEAAQLPTLTQNDVIVSNSRHYEALKHALDAIRQVEEGLTNNLSGDFITQDLRECIHHLSDIIGEVTTDEILNNIFLHFCIGK